MQVGARALEVSGALPGASTTRAPAWSPNGPWSLSRHPVPNPSRQRHPNPSPAPTAGRTRAGYRPRPPTPQQRPTLPALLRGREIVPPTQLLLQHIALGLAGHELDERRGVDVENARLELSHARRAAPVPRATQRRAPDPATARARRARRPGVAREASRHAPPRAGGAEPNGLATDDQRVWPFVLRIPGATTSDGMVGGTEVDGRRPTDGLHRVSVGNSGVSGAAALLLARSECPIAVGNMPRFARNAGLARRPIGRELRDDPTEALVSRWR
jgi:hypothetical protein